MLLQILRNITDDFRQFGLPYEDIHCVILLISCKPFSINSHNSVFTGTRNQDLLV